MIPSRPQSLALMPAASSCSNPESPPSLRDILSNAAPPPYTLGAFTAFLSQNHCLETLEFTLDADRYRTAYSDFVREQAAGYGEAGERACAVWQKIINAYILPYGHREVNLPAHVRDRLLSLPATPQPPDPSELDEAVRIVYELMNDSVLGPFRASVSAQLEESARGESYDPKQARSRLRIPKDQSSSSEESSRSPRIGLLPLLNMPWSSEPKSSTSSSSDPAERAGFTDESANTSSPTSNEPMTPPTTPPLSNLGFTGSPGGLPKAASSHTSGWKKMGAKLGLGRMGRSKRGHSSSATSAPVDVDVHRRDPDQPRRKTNPL
ncbi:cfb81196-3562-4da5-b705-50625ed41a08 [Thermothielavioides terrestris]|uniref:RGS domain-containing protein n=2 Tax=Thermothielavioides terrestris TaxID=2587410 RepID=G2QUT2_THETT|nr:uncharacterized protein THITE_2109285 [Thermothielavioides terrestris NRRL 8126]XP_003657921.1 uncharacterized protein THITE_2124138 [Thermothielavioides terrestris NRRL 8126]AEO63727.1 hypothetical protein THITE_2109285 [Thermothielavioides terrestris NRRL 8126]AEO71585.1 hypothetical protein THITE_2124138 [Thermothielavioides terrestris NRRL 8126]SPQ27431.1 cfb81196-3562-4da5-b705-50625ed41a08 [Thermothielavioides terrestris]